MFDNFKTAITKIVEDSLKPLTASIKDISDQLTKVDMESTKNFLVRCLADIEKGDGMTETELERFWEQYDHYTHNGGNTYIVERVNKLKAAGKL